MTASLGQSACTPCTPGQYQSMTGATSCVDVDAGHYSLARATTQLACSPGTFRYVGGQSSCIPCPAGTYQSLPGQTSCVECPDGSCGGDAIIVELPRQAPAGDDDGIGQTPTTEAAIEQDQSSSSAQQSDYKFQPGQRVEIYRSGRGWNL